MFARAKICGAPASKRQTPDRTAKIVRQRIKKQRRVLKRKDRRIGRLKRRLSATNERSKEVTETEEFIPHPGKQRIGTLPDFLIIGAQKSGTSFFYQLLSQHPHIKPASVKEIHYFDLNFEKSVDWYRSHFPPHDEVQDSLTGEASPYYMFHPCAPARAAHIVPRARLIFLLRNPVNRAYSHYNHAVRRGREPLGFEEALEVEELRLRCEVEKMLENKRYISFNHQWFSYLSRGVYIDHILAWSEFFDKDQMLVVKAEDFFADSPRVMERASDFLGLPWWSPENLKPRSNKSYKPMSSAARHHLSDYFEPHNRRLYDFLGVDFGW
jgi:hypothetical protein